MEKKTLIDRDTLFLYFDGRLPEEEMARIMDWSMESEENFALLLKERKLYDTIQLSDDKVFLNTDNKENAGTKRFNFSGTALWRTAAAVAIIAALSLGFGMMRLSREPFTAMNTISAPAGDRAQVTLSDGTVVWLNSGTTLEYPTHFARKGNREIKVDGQINLDVSHDEKHPFIVHTYLADIKVLGTKFDVNASKEEGTFETSLFEGSVSVFSPDGKGKAISLTPDHKVMLFGGELCLREIDDYEIYRWTEGLYCFKEKKFSQIMKDFERYYNKKIVYTPDPILEKEPLTGKFRISDGFDYAMEVLKLSLPFTYTKDQETGTVYIHSSGKR
ncbi:MAG: FecR family protein [Bacteroidales bacterium]|nr:FecR family protein [Bacteroidales bacterium]